MSKHKNLQLKDNSRVRFGEALRELRKSRSFSIEQLAADAEISAPALSHIENGLVEQPKLDTLRKLFSVLNEKSDVLFSERKMILEGFGYKCLGDLPNTTDIKHAVKAWSVPFKQTGLPAYLVDYAQRVHDINDVALRFLGIDPEVEASFGWTVFDLAFNERFQNNVIITNRDEFILQMVKVMKSEFVSLMAEEWCINCIRDTQSNYPIFKTIWESINASETPEVGVRTMGPIHLSIDGMGDLSFDLVGTDLISDPRFRAIQYIPCDSNTYQKCFSLFNAIAL